MLFFLFETLYSQLYAVSDGCSLVGLEPSQKAKLGRLKIASHDQAAWIYPELQTLAGGADFLTHHPEKILDAFTKKKLLLPKDFSKKLLQLYCSHQPKILRPYFQQHPKIFKLYKQKYKQQIDFDEKTLKFLSQSTLD
jgi:hypothetical protein